MHTKWKNSIEVISIFTDELKAVVGIFCKYNYELCVAGGAGRDILMEITQKGVDFGTTAAP
uniref:Poly A polymerase head domain-containing protein n=1 Tax=Glossina palpalis gambiensis TaxID=67801 RepID=A0A1B0C5I2_9MUSC